jgi:hypothetical protein
MLRYEVILYGIYCVFWGVDLGRCGVISSSYLQPALGGLNVAEDPKGQVVPGHLTDGAISIRESFLCQRLGQSMIAAK